MTHSPLRRRPFGRERDASGPQAALPSDLGGDFRYHGQWQDAPTGLYHVRARVCDPVTGRFPSRDPVEGAFDRPESFHPYTWNANPHVYRDPAGEFSLISISVANGTTENLTNISRASLINWFRSQAKDQALSVAGDLFLGVLRTLIPSIAPDLGRDIEALTGLVDSGAAGIASSSWSLTPCAISFQTDP